MAIQLTLTDDVAYRTDEDVIIKDTELTAEITASTGWIEVNAITCIVKSESTSEVLTPEEDEITIPAKYTAFNFTLQFIGKDSEGNEVIRTIPTMFMPLSAPREQNLPDLPIDAANRNLVLEARQGTVEWKELTVLS